jgi:hypothetical protein
VNDDIMKALNQGKLVVWKDDGKTEGMDEDYMRDNFVGVAKDMEEAAKICRDLQDAERDKHGRALTRLRITGAFDDYVCSEDSDEDVEQFMKK